VFDELEELVHREMERGKVPGLAIALVKGSEIVWSKGYGYADLESTAPITPSTVFHVQSVTKPVVATALMQWHERGRFGLDNPANSHLGPVRIQNEWEDRVPVTVRHLLTHTSGLPVYIGALTRPETGPRSLEEYLAAVATTVRPPGEDIVYANWGYDTIGYLVGLFAGEPYDAYLDEHVLQPLGMRSSAVGWAPEGAPVATGYFLSAIDGQHHGVDPPAWETRPPGAAGALLSTVEDLGRFLIAHLNGGEYEGRRVLSERTVSDMHSVHAAAGRPCSGMGLGFRVDRTSGRRLVCHGGDGTGSTTFIGAYPEEKVGVVLLMNLGRAQTTRSVIANAALRLLAGDYRPHDYEALKAGSMPEEWARITGNYLSTYWDVETALTIEGGTPVLTATGPFLVSNGGAKSYLEPAGEDIFRACDGACDGFELAFDYGDGGKAARFYGGVYPFRFERTGDIVACQEPVVDEEAVLVGRWSGTVSSPLGLLPASLEVQADGATATVLSAQGVAVDELRAEGGRISGHFELAVPNLGDFRIFLRLESHGGRLGGRVYARGAFGEVPMPAEFSRE
jgi:CubicO group peptidase (beta-lactamase class C family)